MEHKQKTFTFVGKAGTARTFTSKKYCFKVEDVLKERCGKDLNKVFRESLVEFEFSLDDVAKDFPRLLDGEGLLDIDWSVQDWDEILSVYAFFLLYRKNAAARQLQYSKETLALEMDQVQEILTSLPPIISQIMNLKDTPDT